MSKNLFLTGTGTYVGKTYGEVKARPRYHIEMLLDAAQTQKA